jgi:membrane-associated phospholipid phosphatase
MNEPGAATRATGPAPRRRYPWLVAAALVLLFALLTVNVLTHGPLTGLDRWIHRAVRTRLTAHERWLSFHHFSLAKLLMNLGNYEVAIAVLVVTGLVVAALRRSWRPLVAAAAGAALLLVTLLSAKYLIARPHPSHHVLRPGALGAFPSGHTASATVCYLLAVLLLTDGLRPRARRIALAAAAVLCFGVGWTMTVTGYHWFTDTVGGWTLGVLVVMLTRWLTRARTGPAGPGEPPGPRAAQPEAPPATVRPGPTPAS